MNLFGFGQSAEVDLQLHRSDRREVVEVKREDGKKEKFHLYYDGETVSGTVNINLKQFGKKLEHQGIKIEFVVQIELYSDYASPREFTSLVRELAVPGEIYQNASYNFEFNRERIYLQ